MWLLECLNYIGGLPPPSPPIREHCGRIQKIFTASTRQMARCTPTGYSNILDLLVSLPTSMSLDI